MCERTLHKAFGRGTGSDDAGPAKNITSLPCVSERFQKELACVFSTCAAETFFNESSLHVGSPRVFAGIHLDFRKLGYCWNTRYILFAFLSLCLSLRLQRVSGIGSLACVFLTLVTETFFDQSSGRVSSGVSRDPCGFS